MSNELKVTSFKTLLVLLFCLLIFSACSEKDNGPAVIGEEPPVHSRIPNAVVNMPAESFNFDDSSYTVGQIMYNDVMTNAISLDQFIRKSVTDGLTNISNANESRNLYTYRLVASDGWNPLDERSLKDLSWAEYIKGYLIPSDRYRVYYPDFSAQNVNGYNVRNINKIELYRTIIVVKPNSDEVVFQISQFNAHQNIPDRDANPNPAFKFTDLITPFITKTPASYNYVIKAIDHATQNQATQEYTWEEFQKGYLTLGEGSQRDRTTFVEFVDGEWKHVAGMSGGKQFLRNPLSVTLVNPAP